MSRSLLDKYLEFQSHLRFPIANAALNMFDQITLASLEDLIQDFLDDLKVHLMQEVRKSLSALAKSQQGSGNVPSVGGLSERDFLYFAEEAEFLGNLQCAKYYIEVLFAKYGKTKENLLAAATLFARLGNREEAIVCLKWVLETDPGDIKALLCLGVLLAELPKLDEAKRILEAASNIEPTNPSVWIILGLFYESINDIWNYERANVMLKQMKKSEIDENIDGSASQDTNDTIPEYASSCDLINTFGLLFQLHASSFINRGLARLLLHCQSYRSQFERADNDDDSVENLRLPEQVPRSTKNYADYMHDLSAYYRFSASFLLQSSDRIGSFQESECELKKSLTLAPESAENWCLMGLVRCLQMDVKAASECFETAMQLETWPVQNHRLYRLKLARCYNEIGNYENSKIQYLECCQQYSTPESWKGVGLACYRMNELEASKLAFEESNRLNSREVIVWTYLAKICLETGKPLEAKECLKIVDKLGLTDEALKAELEQIRLEEGGESD
nr:tetratricopeptide repeat protein 18 [Hymenolepis microstoma]